MRCGKGFRYVGPDGKPLRDDAELARVKALVLPPAWQDVWICTDPAGHLQATGVDAAGRRQYRYHDDWRTRRDACKHDRMLRFAGALPAIRATTGEHLSGRGFTRERVLAAAVRLIDLGFFRSGGDSYAAEHETYGIATVLREHVRCRQDTVVFEYSAKGSLWREQAVAEPHVCAVVKALRRRGGPSPQLLAYRNAGDWHDVRSADINAYLREISGGDYTAKDFRTWHATVLAAVGLAVSTGAPDTVTGRKRAVSRVVQEVAHYLGNTPAVARRSYIDPRVISLYADGITVSPALKLLGSEAEPGEMATSGKVETAVRRMLDNHGRAGGK